MAARSTPQTKGWTVRGLAWERRQSLYLALYLTWFLYWVPLVYTGLRVLQPKWVVWGALYGLPFFIKVIFGNAGGFQDWLDRWQYLAFLASLLHTWLARGEFLARLDNMEAEREEAMAATGARAAGPAREIRAGITEHEHQRRPLKLPDLNALTEEQFALLPGFGPELAKKAVTLRRRLKGFESFAQLAQELPLDLEAYQRLRPIFEGKPAVESELAEAIQGGVAYSVSPKVDFFSAEPEPRAPHLVDYAAGAASAPRAVDAGRGIELNSAAEDALAMLPGIGAEKAKQAVASRAANGPFRSIEDFAARLMLSESVVARIRPLVSVAAPAKPDQQGGGRVVDV